MDMGIDGNRESGDAEIKMLRGFSQILVAPRQAGACDSHFLVHGAGSHFLRRFQAADCALSSQHCHNRE